MEIKILHVEASTYCNARCPLCPRNAHGYNVPGVYAEQHLSIENYKKALEKFPNLKFVYFNGNLGDPMMNPDILELAKISQCYTNIFTNGSIGREETWKGLAKLIGEVTFSIDGLEDTNHLYRQDVDWNKLMQRIKWYIEAGGTAVWKWIKFKHNQHQIHEAETISKQLGFKRFDVVDHGRNYGPALNKKAEITHWILPADGSKSPEEFNVQDKITRYKLNHDNWNEFKGKIDIACEHEIEQKVYVDVNGDLSPCCYQGFKLPNRKRIDLTEFQALKDTWSTTSCDKICASTCGKS